MAVFRKMNFIRVTHNQLPTSDRWTHLQSSEAWEKGHVSIWVIAPIIRKWHGVRHPCKTLMSSATVGPWCPLSPTSTTTRKWRLIQNNKIPLNRTYPLHQREKSSARWHHWQLYWAVSSWAFYSGFNCTLKTNLGRRHPLCEMVWFIPNQAQLHLCLTNGYLSVCAHTYLAWGL